MRQTVNRKISLLVILTLIFSILPLSIPVHAGSTDIMITYPTGDGTSTHPPTEVSTKKITVTGTFTGVTDIKYKIAKYRQIGSTYEKIADTERDGVDPARITGTNSFEFQNVDLYEGLNGIYVYGYQNGNIVGEIRYVEYITLPVITSALWGNQNLLSDNVITSTLPNGNELFLKGEVLNALQISAEVNGVSYAGTVDTNSSKYFIDKIALVRGKNTIKLTAKNQNKTFPFSFDVIYDDKTPYIGNGQVLVTTTPSNTYTELKDGLLFSTDNLNISGILKNFDISENQMGEVTISVNGHTLPKFSVANYQATLDGNDIILATANYSIKKNKTGSDDGFILDITDASGWVQKNKTNNIVFSFVGYKNYTASYKLSHYDGTSVYLTSEPILPSTTTSNRLSMTFTTNKAVSNINEMVKLGTSYITSGITNSGTTYTVSNILLAEGNNVFQITPNGSGNTDHMKTYTVLYVNSPDVKITNLISGDRVGSRPEEINERDVKGEIINFTNGGSSKLVAKIRNSMGESPEYAIIPTGPDLSGRYTFTFSLDLITTQWGKLAAGANDIIFRVTEGSTTTETKITLFYFPTDGPNVVVSLDEIRNDNAHYLFEYKDSNTYETRSNFAYLYMPYSNSKELILRINGKQVLFVSDADGTATYTPSSNVQFEVVTDIATSAKSLITKDYYPIALENGPNTIELEGISSDGSRASSKIFINRFNPPVEVVMPDESQKVVTSNFLQVEIEAASADKVTIGKGEAKYIPYDLPTVKLKFSELPNTAKEEIMNKFGKTLINHDILTDAEYLQIDQSLLGNKTYQAEVYLKPGKNTISYQVEDNGTKTKYTFDVFYADGADEGARYKAQLKSGNFSAYDKKVNIVLPKKTWLIKPGQTAPSFSEYEENPYLEVDVVDKLSGKRKVWDRLINKYVFEDFDATTGMDFIMENYILPPYHTGYAGNIYWIEADGNYKKADGGLVPNNPGKITLTYDNSIRDDVQNLLAIYYFDPKAPREKWQNLGGVVDTKKKTVTAPLSKFGFYTVMVKQGTFTDILEHPWAANYLQTMYAKGLMLNENTNRFGSDLLIGRGEFATILVKAMDIPLNHGPYLDTNELYPVKPTFIDVNPLLDPENGFYSYKYVETAGRAGIIRGAGQGQFMPEELLTREQAAIMIARAANMKIQNDLDKAKASLGKMFADTDKISLYAAPFIEAVVKAQVMNGSLKNGAMSFNSTGYLSRAEAASIAYKLLVNQKKLPK